MKILVLVMIATATMGCSTTDDRKVFFEGATACNTVCMDNPAINEISSTVGGGFPLLFMGGMEIKCSCNRNNK